MDLPNLNLPSYPFVLKKKEGKLYIKCIVRNKILLLTPEEWVRQNFIAYLIQEKNTPKNLIAVEKQILVNDLIKRFDILVYNTHGVAQTLVECKAPKVEVNQAVFEQISGYNMTLKVPYLIVTNGLVHYVAKVDFTNKKVEFLKEIPMYNTGAI